MTLKQLKPIDRIIFLKEFTRELIINSGEPEKTEKKIKKQIEVEKLRQKFLKSIDEEEEFKKSISAHFFQKPVYPKIAERKPIVHRARIPTPPKQKLIQKQPIQVKTPPQITQQPKTSTLVKPEARKRPGGFFLGKLEPLIKDPSIQSIECPGPGKNVLVKRYNRINMTKITLTQSEITDIINNFSENARIPIVGGILKAAVGDLIISAVTSEFVGSRFIINKITPYSLIA